MKKITSLLLAALMLATMLTVFAVSASAEEEHIHAFDKNGKCACGATFSMDEYARGGDGFTKTVTFIGAEGIYVKTGDVSRTRISDKNGNGTYLEPYTIHHFSGDTIRICCDLSMASVRLSYICPKYDDNVINQPFTCTQNGKYACTYLGTEYIFETYYARHMYGLDKKCVVCHKQFSVEELEAKFRAADNQTETFVFYGAESITVTASVSYGGANPHFAFFDKDGKLCGYIRNSNNPTAFTIPGNTARMESAYYGRNVYEKARIYSVTPNYPDFTKTPKTENGIYPVNDEGDFYNLIQYISNGKNFSGVTVSLNADLDLTRFSSVNFSVSGDKAFCGTFNGNGHTIKGVKDTGGEYGGLFHVLGTGAVIKDLTLENVNISTTRDAGALASTATDRVTISNVNVTSGTVNGKYSVGGLVGWFQGGANVSNCSNAATVSGGEHCGGIGGCLQQNYQYIMKNCQNSGSISASKHAGGIAGFVDNDNTTHDFSGCTNSGTITSDSDTAGGIVGTSYGGGNYTYCKNTGNITGKHAGGILAWNEDNAIDFSYSSNRGNIYATKNSSDGHGGGIAGYLGDEKRDPAYTGKYCTNTGNVTATDCAGGIIGRLQSDGTHDFSNCTNSGTIEGKNNSAGGIIGANWGNVLYLKNCQNTGAVKAKKNAGGMIGWDENGTVDCSNSSNSGKITGGGTRGQIYGYTGGGKFTTTGFKQSGSTATGSVLSEGNLWIVISVVVLAIGGVAALFILKKKKKPIAANGASTEDE